MRFAYVADVPWWAIARHGQALVDHHDTAHVWELWFVSDDAKERHLKHADLDSYDAVVYGGLSVWWVAQRAGWAPRDRCVVVTMASFRDAQGLSIADVATGELVSIASCLDDPRICALVVNDRRMTPWVIGRDLPVIVHPDRVDVDVFSQRLSSRASAFCMGRKTIRAGWAGSEVHWAEEKHLDVIKAACRAVYPPIELALQRREHEGLRTQAEMAAWYHELDVYLCANDELTPSPVPVLEALACGTMVITTRCGETWPIVDTITPAFVLAAPEESEIVEALNAVDEIISYRRCTATKTKLAAATERILSWQHSGEARLFTQTLEALCAGR